MVLESLNQEQKEAVCHTDGPLLIVAGAGTGKTTVITERIAWLIKEKMAKADEILALTFTDKAAGEMVERVDQLLPYGYTDLWVMTFHSFAERILKDHALDIGIPNDFKLLNQTEQWMLVRENLDKFNLDYYKPLGNPTKFIHALIKHFSRCKDEEIWPEDYIGYVKRLRANTKLDKAGDKKVDMDEIERLEEVADAYRVYQQLLLDNEVLDFGDLINYSLKIFKKRPNILKHYKDKFKYILVDEFQDTNFVQYELVKLLAGEKANLTVVGDDDQSVYKFRGASVSNILQFKDDYSKSKEVYLNENYRSSQNILDLSYNFIQLNNPERLEVKLGVKNKSKKLSKKLVAHCKEEGTIEHLHSQDENGEVEMVVNKIIDLKNSDKGVSWDDFAILVRANNQAESFLNGLRYAGVPFDFIASKGLYSKEVVRDVLAYLKLLDNYHESLALWRILNLDVIKMDIEDLMEITKFTQRKAYSLYEGISKIEILNEVREDTKKKVIYILKKIKEHTDIARTQGIKEVVLRFLKDFKYREYLLNKNDEKSFLYLRQLFNKIDEFEKVSSEKGVAAFMSLVGLEVESGEEGDLPKDIQEGLDSVKVMTIHGAKGLEFKYVFIVNLVDKRFPSISRAEPIQLPDDLIKEILPGGDVHLQEERRLFYVAMTRAKRGLYFSSAENYGGKMKKKLSRFLYEIGIEKQDVGDVKRKKVELVESKVDKIDLATVKQQIRLLPKTFSYSQLKAFETCPYQYYLNFILKIPVRGKAVFSYGKTMHATLQKFMGFLREGTLSKQSKLFVEDNRKGKKIPSLKELLEIYKESWIDDWYKDKISKKEYMLKGESSLREFHRQVKDSLPQVVELEKGFNFKIGEYSIRGVIDRIDKTNNGGVELIDYKTGKSKTIKTVDKDQLLIYQLAAKEVFDVEVEKLTYYYLDDNTQVSFLGTEKELEKIKQKVIGLIEKMKTTDWAALPDRHKCRFCDFKEICDK